MLDPRKLAILLVDPDEEACSIAKSGLEPDGFMVIIIPRIAEAIGTSQAVQFDLLIIDPMMPHARRLIERMTRFNETQRVLFISDYSQGTLISFGVCPKGADVLRKPFTSREINGRVRSSLALGKAWRDLVRAEPAMSGNALEGIEDGEDPDPGLSESA